MSQPEHPGEAAVSLFEDLPAVQPEQAQAAQQTRKAAKRQGAARLLQPNRSQIELRASDLESLLGEDHLARLVWGYVERQDLSRLIEVIKARGSNAGRAAIDPRILFALWLYAVLSGVGSGREVARLTREHDAYRWICGGVSVNYHALNDFRSGNEALMDEVLTANVAALAAAGAIRAWSAWRRTACGCVPTPGRRRSGERPRWSSTWPRPGSWCARSSSAPRTILGRAAAARRLPGNGRPKSAKSASARRWSNCRRCRRPSGATVTSPSTRGRAPAMPTRGCAGASQSQDVQGRGLGATVSKRRVPSLTS